MTDEIIDERFIQQCLFIVVGSISLFSNIFGSLVTGFHKPLRVGQPFYFAICVSGLISSLSYVISGTIRLYQLNADLYFSLKIAPVECLKQPFIHLYYTGMHLSSLIPLLMAMERLVGVSFTNWYRSRWNPQFSRFLILIATGFTGIALIVGWVAAVYNERSTINGFCTISEVSGKIYGAYITGLMVFITLLSPAISVAALVTAKLKFRSLVKKRSRLMVVARHLAIHMRQASLVLTLNVVSCVLSTATNVSLMNSCLGWSVINPYSIGHQIAVVGFCLSCGLNLPILMALSSEVRAEVERYLRCVKFGKFSSSVLPQQGIRAVA